jgi:hypothetical protein
MAKRVYLSNGAKLRGREDPLPFDVLFVYVFMDFINSLKNILIFLRGWMLVKVLRHNKDTTPLAGIIL